MSEQNCGSCSFRAKYDKNPRSILGRIWRWHAGWCPGWKAYMNSLDSDEKNRLANQYGMKKFMNAEQ
jgi:hypothetical protein